MNHTDRINRVLDYIEANLDQDLHLGLLARRCALSRYHFHRIFRALVGETVARYVDRRRLSRAAEDLLQTTGPIVDTAFDYGFRSHESFTRSFKREFGVTPSRFRQTRPSARLDQQHRIGALDLKLTKGTVRPNPRLHHQSPIAIAGLTYTGRDSSAVYELWRRLWTMEQKTGWKSGKRRHFGVCFHDLDQRGRESFTYCAGVEISQMEALPGAMKDRLKEVKIPEGTYAVFSHQGPASTIEGTFERIYSDWLPLSDCTPNLDLDLIVVGEGFEGENRDSVVEIWMPVEVT